MENVCGCGFLITAAAELDSNYIHGLMWTLVACGYELKNVLVYTLHGIDVVFTDSVNTLCSGAVKVKGQAR